MKSQGSGHSGRSDVDRLIEAIQEPHMSDSRKSTGSRGSWGSHGKPVLDKRHSYGGGPSSPLRSRARSIEAASMPEHQRHLDVTAPGEEALPYTNRPMRAIKVPDDEGLPYTTEGPQRPSSQVPSSAKSKMSRRLPKAMLRRCPRRRRRRLSMRRRCTCLLRRTTRSIARL